MRVNFFIELYDDWWSKEVKKLLQKAQKLKGKIDNYQKEHPKRGQVESQLEKLLAYGNR